MSEIFVQRTPSTNEWAEGAWAEVLAAFGAREWKGEDARLVIIQPKHAKHVKGEISLEDFQHPKGPTVYSFGPDNGHRLTVPMDSEPAVYIPQEKTSVTLWSHQAAAVVFWDRRTKLSHGDR